MATVSPTAPAPDLGAQPRGTGLSTPRRFRALAITCVTVLAVVGIASFLAMSSLTSDTERLRDNTGPVMVAAQDMLASVAEADAASTAVFLSGQLEDREQRRLFEEALARSVEQAEDVARLIGDDPAAHESLKSVAAELVVYAGQVETARAANLVGDPDADSLLRASLTTVRDDILPEVERITERAEDKLDADAGGALQAVIVVVGAAVAVVVLVAANGSLRRRTRRTINLGIAAAIVLVAGFGVWAAYAAGARGNDLDSARGGGADSIEVTAQIQRAGFSYKTAESRALIDGRPDETLERLAATLSDGESGLLVDAAGLADSVREDAAVDELVIRWNRSLDTSRSITALLSSGAVDEARALASGQGNVDFNGFNTAVESVLADNRTQFIDGVQSANDRLGLLVAGSIVLPLLAALAAWFGIQARINEYR